MYKGFGKRVLDVTFAGIGILLFSPIFVFLPILLWIIDRETPFFQQSRPGLNGAVFTLIKFRTMLDKKDLHGALLPDDKRLSKLGAFLRRSSLDELPQLWNVLEGSMSVVGPRPLLVEYLSLYSPTQNKRHHVKPGLTGWAQVNGRNALSWPKKLELDVWYVENLSLSLDMEIIFLTVLKLNPYSVANTEENVPMDKFTGQNF